MLSELYHIQPPLLQEDSLQSTNPEQPEASASQLAASSPQCGQQSTQPTSAAEAATPVSSTAGPETFISRQQLGISDTPDAAASDSGMLEDALTANASDISMDESPAPTTSAQVTASEPDGRILKPDQPQPRPLCSQEWKVQHVSSDL